MYRNKVLGDEHLEVFRYLKDKFMGDALIAGGAVRDMFFKRPFKDIDIWYHSQKIGVPQRFFEIYLPKDLQFNPKEDYIDVNAQFPGEEIRPETPEPTPPDGEDPPTWDELLQRRGQEITARRPPAPASC